MILEKDIEVPNSVGSPLHLDHWKTLIWQILPSAILLVGTWEMGWAPLRLESNPLVWANEVMHGGNRSGAMAAACRVLLGDKVVAEKGQRRLIMLKSCQVSRVEENQG